jgi:hypothetical protein
MICNMPMFQTGFKLTYCLVLSCLCMQVKNIDEAGGNVIVLLTTPACSTHVEHFESMDLNGVVSESNVTERMMLRLAAHGDVNMGVAGKSKLVSEMREVLSYIGHQQIGTVSKYIKIQSLCVYVCVSEVHFLEPLLSLES